MRTSVIFGVIWLSGVPGLGAQSADSAWKKLQFLIGNWTGIAGEKDTPLGAGQGGFSFEPELNQKIIVRHNHAAYNSGASHEDLIPKATSSVIT
jgi:hypothetical protein